MNTKALMSRFIIPRCVRIGCTRTFFSSARVTELSRDDIDHYTKKSMEHVYGNNWETSDFFSRERPQKVSPVVKETQTYYAPTFDTEEEKDGYELSIKHTQGGY